LRRQSKGCRLRFSARAHRTQVATMPSVSGRFCVAAVGHFMQEGLEPNGVARANGGLHRRSCTSPERALSAPCVRPRLRCGDQFGVRVPSRGSLRHGCPSVGLLDARGSCPTDQRIGGPGGVLSIRRRGEDVSEQAPSLLNSLDGRLRRSVVSPRSPTLCTWCIGSWPSWVWTPRWKRER